MLTRQEITATVKEKLRAILLDDLDDFGEGDAAVAISDRDNLIELGLNSLMLARLVIQLAAEFGADPFSDDAATLADARTVGELVTTYERALEPRTELAS